MKPSLAHLSPTLPAALATGVAVTLSVFLLAGAEPQGEPAPLLPAIGGAAVHVIANLPATPRHHVSEAVARPVPPPALVTARSEHVALRQHAGPTHAQRPTHHVRARVRRPAPRPAQAAPPPAPVPVTRQTFHAAPVPRGRARGHSHGHSHGGGPAAPTAAHVHGHGKALGHTHRGAPPGHAKKAPTAPHPEHVAPPKANGGGPPPGHGGGNGHGGKQ